MDEYKKKKKNKKINPNRFGNPIQLFSLSAVLSNKATTMVLFCKNLLDMNESDFTTMVATKS
jgi:hypothetical protein